MFTSVMTTPSGAGPAAFGKHYEDNDIEDRQIGGAAARIPDVRDQAKRTREVGGPGKVLAPLVVDIFLAVSGLLFLVQCHKLCGFDQESYEACGGGHGMQVGWWFMMTAFLCSWVSFFCAVWSNLGRRQQLVPWTGVMTETLALLLGLCGAAVGDGWGHAALEVGSFAIFFGSLGMAGFAFLGLWLDGGMAMVASAKTREALAKGKYREMQ